jgi:hypothetical protein
MVTSFLTVSGAFPGKGAVIIVASLMPQQVLDVFTSNFV